MQLARRISQIVFLIFFLFLFFLATYPLTSKIPVDLFLRIDPLIGLSAVLTSRSFFIKSIPAIILLILTVVFGRFFCGWICPLGTTIDGSDHLMRARYQREKKSSLKWMKFSTLIIVLLGGLISVQLAGFVDPISLFTRTMTTFLYPIFVLASDGLMGFIMSISFLEEPIFCYLFVDS